jgi:hypothetical protein
LNRCRRELRTAGFRSSLCAAQLRRARNATGLANGRAGLLTSPALCERVIAPLPPAVVAAVAALAVSGGPSDAIDPEPTRGGRNPAAQRALTKAVGLSVADKLLAAYEPID